MSYQERSSTVSLMSSLLIFGYYLVNVFQMVQAGGVNSTSVFSLWGTIIVLAIIINILSNIITHIVFAIIYAIRTNEEERLISDERDKLIGLKGTRNAYLIFGLGVFVSMATLVFNMSPLVMFNLLIFFGMAAEIVGDLSRLYFYRRGF